MSPPSAHDGLMKRVGDSRAASIWVEIESDPPQHDATSIESLAADVHDRAGSRNPERLAESAGARVRFVDRIADGIDGLLVGPNIYVRRRSNARHETLVLLHELSHWILRGTHHTHGDVWCLTLALAAPASLIHEARERGRSDMHLQSLVHIPEWALALRLEMFETPMVSWVAKKSA